MCRVSLWYDVNEEINMHTRNSPRPALFVTILCAVVFLSLLGNAPVQARPDALPPRPSPSPTPKPRPDPVGAAIELRFQSAVRPSPVLSTGVQWQDGLGQWHDVTGWQGAPDEWYADGGRKTWWVSEAHLGEGPFRWLVYGENGVIASSVPFTMPLAAGQIVRAFVAVAP